jgi:hypothetical protein
MALGAHGDSCCRVIRESTNEARSPVGSRHSCWSRNEDGAMKLCKDSPARSSVSRAGLETDGTVSEDSFELITGPAESISLVFPEGPASFGLAFSL